VATRVVRAARSPRWSVGKILVVLVAGLGLLSGSCGFQLRDQADLPAALARTHIAGLSPYDNLSVQLRRALQANGIEVVDASRATAILRITNRQRGRRVLAVDADGKVREIEVFATINFELTGRDNPLRLKDQTLTLTRDFVFDETDVLGKAAEAELLYEDMESELVRLILYRLEAAS
jgi:LPS-assembly lipoprotein